ncbi:class I SAM-dependent DNA methyltransferase [Leptospira bouyouniensis]|uniref:site-specific DNA-methyltransferase (adenine-specific) n=1 Tax=Leptospira bouyouniensis TaxID=2484911 RepID=A0A7I0HS45_9LEPT|nr:DNA methyltransferase [Leptospira bouyouniensis]TGL05023.1 class I SAM-dependent DNA methyltransferase [Leptospira bouyouniensis]
MALSPNEIKSRAISFIHDHKDDKYEKGESQIFWRDFFNIWGINAKTVGIFEERAKTLKQTTGFIDYFWPKTILIEQKSRGEDLDKAYKQALDYCLTGGIPDEELPSYICVCDFERLRLVNLTDQTKSIEFKITDLLDHLQRFNFLLGYEQREYKDEDPVNIKAANLMKVLHNELERNGFKDHPLKLMLVRLMFCFFADDTGIFASKDDFLFFLKEKTKEDGSDLGLWIAQFFQILNTPIEKRPANLDEDLSKFPYINGQLFEEGLPFAQFDKKLRDIIIKTSEFNWAVVSPAIFGSLFQSVLEEGERRELGAHYTSENNILKTIHGLFLDEYIEEFENAKKRKNTKALESLLEKIRNTKILDPACGCGNFLILCYRELRLLEIKVLEIIFNKKEDQGMRQLSIEWLNGLDVDSLYGIEIEEFPALIAKTAIWIMDHLMNREASNAFGSYYVRLPLKKAPKIHIGNALRMNWEDIINPNQLSFILGNPPFLGKSNQSNDQKEDMEHVFYGTGIKYGLLDYVSCWYIKTINYISNFDIKVAFVSTNSITQGEQAGELWPWLFSNRIKINFAHQTFKWSNEAPGKAAVHCVIIGFSKFKTNKPKLYIYENINAEPFTKDVTNINSYLTEGSDTVILSRRKPICNVPEMVYGNKIVDDGNYLFTEEEMDEFLKSEPGAKKYFRKILSGDEYINGRNRYVLYLAESEPKDLKNMPKVLDRIQKVKEFRLSSTKGKTKEMGNYPAQFAEPRQPQQNFLLFPRTSSENRIYLPIGFFTPDHIVNDSCTALPGANLYHFGVLTSLMHNAWMRRIAGRLKSDYRYSNSLVYNNFPWPEYATEKQKEEIDLLAQSVLDARAQFPKSSLADLYDPLTMPKVLRDAHNKLDKAVDKAYRSKPFQSESERVEFLFELYEKYVNTLTSQIKAPGKKRSLS